MHRTTNSWKWFVLRHRVNHVTHAYQEEAMDEQLNRWQLDNWRSWALSQVVCLGSPMDESPGSLRA